MLTPRASGLARKGRPWFFADDVGRGDRPADGLVRVLDAEGRDLGLGLWSAAARLCLRLCGPWEVGNGSSDVPDRVAFYGQRVRSAVARRDRLRGAGRGCRLVHGESDGLPGIVVDEYDGVCVVQVTSAAVEAAMDALVPAVVDATGARAVLARNDVPVRRLEGLPREVRWLHGRPEEEVEIEEHGVRHRIALTAGHKTGFYLDQRPARALVQQLARGRRALDAFSYQGGFALAALSGGAEEVVALDQSGTALERAQRGATRNGFEGLRTIQGNAFTEMRALRDGSASFGLVVVDPPAFAKNRREVRGAQRGYRDLNRLALRLLAPGGHLVTCSCSHHVDLPGFEDLVRQGAAGLPFRTMLRGRLGAGEDHPAWMSLPESEYLKVLHLQRVDA